jgi:hypothetical protein
MVNSLIANNDDLRIFYSSSAGPFLLASLQITEIMFWA